MPMKYVTLSRSALVPYRGRVLELLRMRISIVYLFSDKMAEKADPTSIDSPEPTPPVWRIEREEVPLSRGESRNILAKRLGKQEKLRGQVDLYLYCMIASMTSCMSYWDRDYTRRHLPPSLPPSFPLSPPPSLSFTSSLPPSPCDSLNTLLLLLNHI